MLVNGINNRGVVNVSIIGYSHGGGATRDLAERLERNKRAVGSKGLLTDITNNFSLVMTAYVDAVNNGMTGAERRLPPGPEYHLNLYQLTGLLWIHGDTTIEDIPTGFVDLEQIDTINDWGLSVDHFTIDDHPRVKSKLSEMLKIKVPR